ncbi:hypothetical protein ABIB90_004804, partial [Bradyrhizobium sp. JR4.1]|uniref:hypothetical protein n=1 Tax=Bradyrhizobium sp. JR4.1 TaxID=3156372 RepID=UPI0033925B7B
CCHGIGALPSGTLIKPPEPKMTRARSSPDAYGEAVLDCDVLILNKTLGAQPAAKSDEQFLAFLGGIEAKVAYYRKRALLGVYRTRRHRYCNHEKRNELPSPHLGLEDSEPVKCYQVLVVAAGAHRRTRCKCCIANAVQDRSALGHSPQFASVFSRSALAPTADVRDTMAIFAFGPTSDIHK